jgi:hypothetical protein
MANKTTRNNGNLMRIVDLDDNSYGHGYVSLSNVYISSFSQTRPIDATAYAASDVVGEDAAEVMTFADLVSIAGSAFKIVGVTLETDVAAIPAGMATMRLHLFTTAPTAITDNLAFNLPAADRTKYLGFITLATSVDLGDTLWSQNNDVNFRGKLATDSKTIYGVLETVAGFTPSASDVRKITLYSALA